MPRTIGKSRMVSMSLWLKVSEHRALQDLCRSIGSSRAEFVRRAVRKEMAATGLEPCEQCEHWIPFEFGEGSLVEADGKCSLGMGPFAYATRRTFHCDRGRRNEHERRPHDLVPRHPGHNENGPVTQRHHHGSSSRGRTRKNRRRGIWDCSETSRTVRRAKSISSFGAYSNGPRGGASRSTPVVDARDAAPRGPLPEAACAGRATTWESSWIPTTLP